MSKKKIHLLPTFKNKIQKYKTLLKNVKLSKWQFQRSVMANEGRTKVGEVVFVGGRRSRKTDIQTLRSQALSPPLLT